MYPQCLFLAARQDKYWRFLSNDEGEGRGGRTDARQDERYFFLESVVLSWWLSRPRSQFNLCLRTVRSLFSAALHHTPLLRQDYKKVRVDWRARAGMRRDHFELALQHYMRIDGPSRDTCEGRIR